MTPEAFLALHLQDQINIIGPFTFNVNVDTIPPPQYGIGVVEPGDMYILNVAVNTQAIVDGVVEIIPDILQQVEEIRFTFQNKIYTLEVLSATRHENFGTEFFFYTVFPFKITDGESIIQSANFAPHNQSPWPVGYALQENTIINFTPFISDIQGLLADYSVLINNAFENRKSYKIRQSQRVQSTTIPTNFGPIYSGSAELANIQDSLYYDTGWTNGRYNGSVSTPVNYAGVPPSLTGKAFTGEAYASVTDDDFICAVPYDVRVFEEFFHTGNGIYPAYEELSIGIKIPSPQPDGDTTISYIGTLSGSLDEGDIIMINDEKMRVLEHRTTTSPPEILVERPYFGTVSPSSHGSNTPIKKIARVDLFRFSESNAQIVQADSAKVYVRETGHVLFTDIFGTVANFVTCSINFVTIDDPND